jgi:hypothetical protein
MPFGGELRNKEGPPDDEKISSIRHRYGGARRDGRSYVSRAPHHQVLCSLHIVIHRRAVAPETNIALYSNSLRVEREVVLSYQWGGVRHECSRSSR